ncbi:probable E3 ubiquitin-protein ligase RHY1A isoform X1 [Zerene cesonia]|uniref:probable E3 ubiquitin-protein ligase RHY1A isoform X1 n=1 Tax=Zerene cesonia TaxID=33412 RepID=UPI0018E52D5F|nr:probable E3 ubiquitin-protein ligase RHY1A isoform X1 [Zerene cesonia]
MSVREEDGPKNSSSSRGLGLAAAAIGVGVGVGAALYYFFGQRPENPDSAGSTSQWETEQRDALAQESIRKSRRNEAFRERSWTLEECTICYEVILKNQEVMSLPCTHNFHSACILPWLQQQQTCPNCRTSVK